MATEARMRLAEVEQKVCDIVSAQLQIPRHQISPTDRLIEDLHCDSLELVELLMNLEEAFDVSLPQDTLTPVGKAIFSRQPFRVADLAELVYFQQGTGKPERRGWLQSPDIVRPSPGVPFTQLDGRYAASLNQVLFDSLNPTQSASTNGQPQQYRRRSDGMRCVLIPEARVVVGSAAADSLSDEQPVHETDLDAFLIDAEPVSTTAYCRFLNSIAPVEPAVLSEWFVLASHDRRRLHVPILQTAAGWRPKPQCEQWPMILVSWYGANAYSLWANGRDWTNYRDEPGEEGTSYLPSEAQWEYAARGAYPQSYPWGDRTAGPDMLRFGRHCKSQSYNVENLPLAGVHELLGMSPFGLHHMAGNVWQWCRDWYAPTFYQTPAARIRNPLNRTGTGTRSERGGSWIGPQELCRSSYRRGRSPSARGRCLGFRCVSSLQDAE